jgi:hypothetical protein
MSGSFRFLVAAAAIAVSVPQLHAQQAAALGAARVTLVAGASPSRGGRTEVVRRAQRTPKNVIIVDRNATAEDLAAALATVNALRAAHGDSLTSDFRARPETVRPGPTWQKSAYRNWLIEQLVRLRTARTITLDGLGQVKAVQVTLPAPPGVVAAAPGGRK